MPKSQPMPQLAHPQKSVRGASLIRVILAALVALLTFAPAAYAQCTTCGTTIAGGPVSGFWPLAGSPYCITGDIDINGLIIEAGVCVRADPGVVLRVQTSISAVGTAELPIVFTSRSMDRWSGLSFPQATPPGSRLVHCRIEKAGNCGLHLVDSTPEIRYCEISDNFATSGRSAGINASMAPGLVLNVRDTVIASNSVNPTGSAGSFVGGGIRITGECLLQNCTVRNNSCRGRCTSMFCSSSSRGGGMFLSGTATLENCHIEGNQATNRTSCNGLSDSNAYGGGIYFSSGDLRLSNTIIACNGTAASCGTSNRPYGSGIYINGGTATINHCTIVANDNEGVRRAGGTVTLNNSIFYSNGTQGVVGAVTATFCCIEGGFTGTGNIAFSPAFSGQGCDALDLVIVSGSPCVDGGDPSGAGDSAFPPSYGTATPDIGAHGGPLAGAWGAQVGASYCSPAVPNTSGSPGVITAWSPSGMPREAGRRSAVLTRITLRAAGLPSGQFGFFATSRSQGIQQPASSDGPICLVGTTIGRLSSQIFVGPVGQVQIDLGAIPPNLLQVQSGSTWNFQAWHRDGAPGLGSNFTDAVSVTFP